MSTLHLIYTMKSLKSCQKTLADNDALILLQEGVYLLTEPIQLPERIDCYALKADIDARGITTVKTDKSNHIIIDDSDFVDLVIQHDNSISWL